MAKISKKKKTNKLNSAAGQCAGCFVEAEKVYLKKNMGIIETPRKVVFIWLFLITYLRL